MSDIRKLLDIINETTVAGSVATVAAPMGEMHKRVEETATEETKNPEVIEYGMWENSALATTSKLKKNRGKSAKVVKSIYGEDVQSEAANPKQQAAIAIAKKKEVSEGKFTINAKTGAKLDPRTGVELPPKEKPLTMKDMFRQPKATSPKLSLDDVWRKVEDVVGQIFPDGDPIDHLAPWLEKHGIRDFKIGEILDRAAKKNGYEDLYDYYDSMKDQYARDNVAEGSEKKDMTGQTCEKCKKDKYQERSWNDDRNGTLQCSCGHVVDRWRKYKKKDEKQGVAEGSGNTVDFPIANVRRPNGAIGTQGVTTDQVAGVLKNVTGLDVSPDMSMKELVDTLRGNAQAQQQLRQFTKQNPVKIQELPDGTYHIQDGHHRTFLLNLLGDKTVPALVNGGQQGVAEGKPNQLPTQGADYSKYDTDHLRILLKPGILHRNEARFKALIRKELRKREQQGVAEGTLEEIDRRGFLRGAGAAAIAGAAGDTMAGTRNPNQEYVTLTNGDKLPVYNSIRDVAPHVLGQFISTKNENPLLVIAQDGKKYFLFMTGRDIRGKLIRSHSTGISEDNLSESDLILNPASLSKLSRDLVSHDHDRTDHEVEMAKSDLYQAGKNAVRVFELIKDITEEEGLEGWVQEKIIKAADYLNTVREYLEGKQIPSPEQLSADNLAMEEGKPGLWDRIHAKRKRIEAGSGERMRKPGSKGAPTAQDFKNARSKG